MKNRDLVSVIVPTYHSKYLSECLNSILLQTHDNIEIIIVDDCSNDGTIDIIKKYANEHGNIKYIINDINQGVGASRNTGIAMARGEYIAFLDHDDMWKPEKISLQIECLKSNANVKAVYCYCRFMNSDEDVNRCISKNTTENLLLYGCEYCMPGSVLMTTEIIREAGLFPTEREISEDLALWLEVSTMTEFSCIQKYLYIHRKHSNHLSSTRGVICDELAVQRFFKRHPVKRTLRRTAEQQLLNRRAFYYRASQSFYDSCYAYLRAWLKNPRNNEPLISLVLNILRWPIVTRSAQKWIKK